MLRALVVSLAVLGMAACGSKHDAPQVDPAAPAGKVLEVSGVVMVGTKALSVGDAIKADDVIDTGDTGTVVIQLAHNDARWELGPKHKSTPRESLAWTAERSTGPAKPVEQDTSAAGRPAERSAADTSTSSRADSAKDTKPAESKGRAEPRSTGSPAPETSAAAAVATPPPPPPPPPPTVEPIESGAKKPDAKPVGGSRAPAKPKTVQAPSAIEQIATLASCLPKGQKLRVNVHIANHVPAIKFETAVDDVVKTCITDAAKKLTLPVESGDMSLSLGN